MINLKNADKALKNYYLDAFANELNTGVSPFYTAIEKNSVEVSGKYVVSCFTRPNANNLIACTDGADLPEPHANTYGNIMLPLKNFYGTIELSDKVIRASRDSEGAFVNLVNAEMSGLLYGAKENFKRMLFGDGSGKLCKIVSKTDAKTYKVDKCKNYLLNLNVDIPAVSGAAGDSLNVKIVSVDIENSTVTFEKAITDEIAGAFVYPHGTKDNELLGLGAIFDSTTLYGNDKSLDPFFVPYKADAEGALTEEKLTDIMDTVEERAASSVNMILCSYATRKKIAALMADNRRIVNTSAVNAGYGTISVSGVPVYAEKYCPDDRIYFINTEDFKLCQLCDWEWLEDDGGSILKQVPGKAAFSATLVKYAELVCKKPCGQGMLYNFG